ncbi:MAG: ribose 5-phosphate isomerase B [Planctomycetes bacterium]|nr:ribose 5-phosphate isomerase B [Planctomycetota bacterium]MCC7170832.1 ribose 5-phosphate isomerase B [Planctomycetota bacterium]
MKIACGADHAGVELKNVLRDALIAAGHDVVDLGTQGDQSVDYPDFAHAVARAVASGQAERGLLVCGSGQGMAMSANRHAGVRAACTRDLYDTRLVREHNDANVLCLGARVVGPGLADEMVKLFLATAFAGGRHAGRVRKMQEPS